MTSPVAHFNAKNKEHCLMEGHISLFKMKYKQQFLKYSRQGEASVNFFSIDQFGKFNCYH